MPLYGWGFNYRFTQESSLARDVVVDHVLFTSASAFAFLR